MVVTGMLPKASAAPTLKVTDQSIAVTLPQRDDPEQAVFPTTGWFFIFYFYFILFIIIIFFLILDFGCSWKRKGRVECKFAPHRLVLRHSHPLFSLIFKGNRNPIFLRRYHKRHPLFFGELVSTGGVRLSVVSRMEDVARGPFSCQLPCSWDLDGQDRWQGSDWRLWYQKQWRILGFPFRIAGGFRKR